MGFSKDQIHNFICQHIYMRKQRQLEAGMVLKKKGSPPKNYIVREEDKIAELRYILDRKEARIKTL